MEGVIQYHCYIQVAFLHNMNKYLLMCSYQDIQQGNVHHIRLVLFLQKCHHWFPLLVVFLFNPHDTTLNITVLTIVASSCTTWISPRQLVLLLIS